MIIFVFLKFLLASRFTLFGLHILLRLGSWIHCNLTYFLWSKKHKQSSTNHGLCCYRSCRTRLSLAEVLMFFLMFSQVIFMSSSSLKFSKAAKLFLISICFSFLTSSSFSFLRLYLSPSNLYATSLLTANLSLNFATTNSDQYHSQLPWNLVHLVCSNPISCLSICVQSGYESSHQERSKCAYECFGVGTLCF